MLVVVASALIALILGEYEMKGAVPLIAGAVVGLLLSEAVVGVGRWRGPAAAAAAGSGGAVSLLLAGWIDSTQGVEPYPVFAAVGAVVAAAVAVARALPVPGARCPPARVGSAPSVGLERHQPAAVGPHEGDEHGRALVRRREPVDEGGVTLYAGGADEQQGPGLW